MLNPFKEGDIVTPKGPQFLGHDATLYDQGDRMLVLYSNADRIILECRYGWLWEENTPRGAEPSKHHNKRCWSVDYARYELVKKVMDCKYSCPNCRGKCPLWESE